MDKAIVVISGTLKGKRKFNQIARKHCFVKNVNIFSQIQRKAEKLRIPENELAFEDQYWCIENEYVGERIEQFQQDDSEEKTVGVGKSSKTFSKALLVLHWISCELTEVLKESEGAMQLHITKRDLEPDIEAYDIVLYEDDIDFKDKLDHFLNTVLNCNLQKEVIQ